MNYHRLYALSCRTLLTGLLAFSLASNLTAQNVNYTVGPHDVLTVAVFDQPNLSGKFTVDADGTFTLPLVGRVTVGGLTLRDVETALRTQLQNGFLKDPQVSVAVDQYRSQRVFVVGEVKSAGTYPLTGDMTLIEALARAGSTTERASGEAIVVRAAAGTSAFTPRIPADVDDESLTIHVNLKALQAGALTQNVVLRDGDTVFIPRAESVYVFGQVRNPGAYALQGDTTILQALSLAGGITDRGSTTRVRLVRMVNGKKSEINVKLDDRVQPGDTVIVPERFF